MKRVFDKSGQTSLYLTDFSLHSIGIMLFQRKMYEAFARVIEELLSTAGIELVRLDSGDMTSVAKISQRFSLDFDDAYQYLAAEKFNLTLVSFDTDFDRTERGRKTPAELLKS